MSFGYYCWHAECRVSDDRGLPCSVLAGIDSVLAGIGEVVAGIGEVVAALVKWLRLW